MWSGETRCSQPPSLARPCTCITLEPMPSIAAPMRVSSRARSCTCGSEAALRMIVEPGVSAAAMSAFSVPITDGSSMKKSHACRPPSGARRRMSRVCSTTRAQRAEGVEVRVQAAAADHVAAGRRQQRLAEAGQQRARRRGTRRGSAPPALGRRRSSVTPSACRATVLPSRRSTFTPRSSSSTIIASVSRIRGTLCSTTCSSVSRQAASSGRAAFLLPAGTMVPDSGTPPSMTSFSIRGGSDGAGRTSVRPGSWARVPTMSLELSRPEAWSLFCEWTESPSLRKHVLAVEAAMRAYARRFGEDEELWGITGPAARPRLRAPSRPRDRPSADGAQGARGARLPARAGARGRLARGLPRRFT